MATRARPSLVPAAIALAACAGLVGCVIYLQPKCDDLIKDGSETDVDCGGSCKPCELGQHCGSVHDCYSGICSGNTCRPQPCFDGVKDGAETDVDCGGGTCRKCAGARHCLVDADCFSGKCEPGTNICYSLTSVSFADGGTYPASYKPYVLFSGDFNRDGHVDLAAANEEASTISVYLGRGDGTFQKLPTDFPTGAYPTGGAVADFNHDGIPDIVTANYHGNSVTILFGVGDGTFQAPFEVATTPGGATSNLAVGDLNGDGFLDVVATNPDASSISVFLGRGDGTLGPATNLLVGANALRPSGPFSAAIGDFNGDGKADVAIADIANRTLVVRLGNGDGTFGPEVTYPEGGVPAYIVIAADVNLDGKLDLVCANRGSNDVSVLLGRGDGTFAPAVVSSTGPGTGPYAVAVADFNLDGVPDVVTPNYLTGNASVLLGNGDGTFAAPIDAGATGNFCYGVATGDFNEDGKPDFGTANASDNDVSVKLNASQ